jgi:hypothetical protein
VLVDRTALVPSLRHQAITGSLGVSSSTKLDFFNSGERLEREGSVSATKSCFLLRLICYIAADDVTLCR